jgi:hypothetical protein
MRYLSFTFISFLIFLASLFHENALSFFAFDDSAEVATLRTHEERYSVKEGMSASGVVGITAVPQAPIIPPRMKASNHERTLRAFVGPDRGSTLTLYIESVKPHRYYSVNGAFTPSVEYPSLSWPASTTLVAYVTATDGGTMRLTVDTHTLVATLTIVGSNEVIPAPEPFPVDPSD